MTTSRCSTDGSLWYGFDFLKDRADIMTVVVHDGIHSKVYVGTTEVAMVCCYIGV